MSPIDNVECPGEGRHSSPGASESPGVTVFSASSAPPKSWLIHCLFSFATASCPTTCLSSPAEARSTAIYPSASMPCFIPKRVGASLLLFQIALASVRTESGKLLQMASEPRKVCDACTVENRFYAQAAKHNRAARGVRMSWRSLLAKRASPRRTSSKAYESFSG